MIEFGSDYHQCDPKFLDASNSWDNVRMYASGRIAIHSLLRHIKAKRLWMPSYFCYEVISYITSLGVKVLLYDDFPLHKEADRIVESLPYIDGDILLRTDYFGLRYRRTNSSINVPVIEDHTHDVYSHWAYNSDADWCIASLRKSLPVAAGGILWSPLGHELPKSLDTTAACDKMSQMRSEAMKLKQLYLYGDNVDKEAFRKLYLQSEKILETLYLSGIDMYSANVVSKFNLKKWVELRNENWKSVVKLLTGRFDVLRPENSLCNPFSVVLCCKTPEDRESLRNYLIANKVYPAILWEMPQDTQFTKSLDFSRRMLSVHCDPRYSSEDVENMCQIINAYYD